MDHASLFYSTIEPTPPGFQLVRLSKRHLLGGTVVVLVRALDELRAVLPDFEQRMRGVVLLPRQGGAAAGPSPGDRALGPLLWLLTPRTEHLGEMHECLAGLLSAIDRACTHEEAQRVALLDNDRLRFELGRVREDYNRVTSKLQKQVNALTEAKSLLESWNEQLEVKVNERTAELARSRKLASLGSLMAGFAHEMNTPLGNALLSGTTLGDEAHRLEVDLAEQRLKRAELESFLQMCCETMDVIQRNLRRAADLIHHFKHAEGDVGSEPLQRFSLADVVQDAVTSFDPSLRAGQHEVVLDIPANLTLESYPGALGQVLSNLISNALRHGFDEQPQGRITISAQSRADDHLALQFADNGCGIPSGQLDKIFDPFYTTKLGQGGSGIGLYLVYKLVYRVLGGTVHVWSEPGRGTRFEITLPRKVLSAR
ncbi:MAG TPA: HAMP domain-containing sensor histidine kinase [Ideonella sp.]|uniref:sensor histidine kinase n=1 Tax=Ideonella sp. TaxID=1929293 RepID=UPI002E306114|nr:HAMP domain-containing sensor histidine kinase [Ideonella sp.]HEX5685622.1 HAMP domain-containing sensor histidine kinase [Ideonella sp.]